MNGADVIAPAAENVCKIMDYIHSHLDVAGNHLE